MPITELLDQIRKLVIISLFADDYLMDIFVLKGGNAINLIYNLDSRSSIDIDVSMANDFPPGKLPEIQNRLEKSFKTIFSDFDYAVFDLKMVPKPKTAYEPIKDFWGGYLLEFKVISKSDFSDLELESSRKQALPIGPKGTKKFKVDISKHEFCEPKIEHELDDYTIYVYPPILILLEKLRAICQQIPEYTEIVKLKPRPRARDFYDIHIIYNKLKLEKELLTESAFDQLKTVFAAKKVPVKLLFEIDQHKAFHETDFDSLKDTISDPENLQQFSYYFDFVVSLTEKLKPFWKE